MINEVVQLVVNITDDNITTDCFFKILERLDDATLERHFGANFMLQGSWIANYVRKI